MNEKRTKIGVIGGGYWGKNLIRVFNEIGVLTAICDLNKTITTSYKETYPDVEIFSDYEKLIKNPGIDALVIATPASTHYKITKSALETGKDVFCEKPLALNTKQGKHLVKIASDNNLILMVGHILHYHPAVEKLKEIVKRKELGNIEYIYSNRLNIGRIRHEENILWSFAPHDISLMLSLTQSLPSRVFSYGGVFLPHKVEDVTLTFFSFPNNIKAHIFVSWLNPFKEQKFVVIGNKKMAVFDDTEKEKKLVFYHHKIKWNNNAAPTIEKAEAEIVEIKKDEPLKKEALHFIECIKKRKKPYTDGKEALNVLKVLEQAEKCLRSRI
ncbi:MAG TPA: Gfo/Idh/MocA family oxidoreductase [bacterium]|nr:Gfo/Idh/MocA family oxidoreductase [bacterium]